MADPNPTTGIGVATNVRLTGAGVVQTVPAVAGKRGVSQYSVSVPIGSSVQVTALPYDDAGNLVPNVGTPAVLPSPGSPAVAATYEDIHLGTSLLNYAVLAYSAVTGSASGNTVISGGNVGISPTALTGVTNFPPSTVTAPGIIEGPDANTGQAQTDLVAAILYWGTTYVSPGGSHVVAADNLSTNTSGGSAGVYHAGKYTGGALDIPTSITLDAQGNPQAIFVFVAASTVTLESGASVILANGAQAGNVYWVVGSSFTSVWNAVQSNMVGNILAHTSVTLGGGTLAGRALANTGAVTMSTQEVITVPVLSAVTPYVPAVPGTPGSPAIPAALPNVITCNSNPSGSQSPTSAYAKPAWFRPSNAGKYNNATMAPVTVDDTDSNPWTVRGIAAGQVAVDFQYPTFLNDEGQSLVDTQQEMDETYIDSIRAELLVTVTGGSS